MLTRCLLIPRFLSQFRSIFHSSKNKQHFQRSVCSSTGACYAIPRDMGDYHAPCVFLIHLFSFPNWFKPTNSMMSKKEQKWERQEQNSKHGQTGPRAKQKEERRTSPSMWPLNDNYANACVIFIHALVVFMLLLLVHRCLICLFVQYILYPPSVSLLRTRMQQREHAIRCLTSPHSAFVLPTFTIRSCGIPMP